MRQKQLLLLYLQKNLPMKITKSDVELFALSFATENIEEFIDYVRVEEGINE